MSITSDISTCNQQKQKPMLRRGSVLARQHLCESARLAVRGQGGVISSDSHVRHLWHERLAGSVLTARRSCVAPVAGAGLVGGGGGVGGAELDGSGVLQRVLARLHLKRCCPHPHQPPLLTCFSLVGHVGRGPPADHTARCEEGQGYQ